MVMKNSELSFRVRTLEDNIAKLRQENSKLVLICSEDGLKKWGKLFPFHSNPS